jgi:hypothetical protein
MEAKLRERPFVIIDYDIFELPDRTPSEIGIYAYIFYSIKKFKSINYDFIAERTRIPKHIVQEYVLDLIREGIIITPKINKNGNV